MSVTIPDSVRKIESMAFEGCESLKECRIPDGVSEISWKTFNCCFNLENIYIPDSVSTIKMEAFDECSKLTVHASEGSAAEKYARDNGIAFVAN